MNDDFANLRSMQSELGSKIRQADVVFRNDYDDSNGSKMPFSSGVVFIRYKDCLEPIYQRLDSGEIDTGFAEKKRSLNIRKSCTKTTAVIGQKCAALSARKVVSLTCLPTSFSQKTNRLSFVTRIDFLVHQ